MGATPCHPSVAEDVGTAREVVLNVIGVKRLADWCGVSVHTPYQWLSRGGDSVAIPASYAPVVIKAARAEGVEFDFALLWPALKGLL